MIPRSNQAQIQYPDDFAQPLMANYTVTVEHGVAETKMSNGWIRRRRLSPWTYRSATLSFRMKVDEFWTWHSWVHENGFRWIEMKVQDDKALAGAEPFLASRVLRFTGAANFTYGDWNTVTVTIPAEFLL